MRIILAILLLASNFAFAQDSLFVSEIHDDMSRGFKPGYSIYIPRSNYKDITADWKKQLKNASKAEITDKKGELITKTLIPEISSDSIVLYSKINAASEKTAGTNLIVFAMGGDSTFINSKDSPSIDGRLKKYMRTFAVSEYKSLLIIEMTNEQRKLDVMKEDLRKMERENENCTKKINSSKNDNARLQELISANSDLLDSKSGEIDQQIETVKDVSASDQKTDEEKKLKQMQKEKSKLSDEDESLRKDMEKNNDRIEENQKKSDLNTSTNIPAKKEQIENQKEVVSNLSKKLNSIR